MPTKPRRGSVQWYRELAAASGAVPSALRPTPALTSRCLMPMVEAVKAEQEHCAVPGRYAKGYRRLIGQVDAEHLALLTVVTVLNRCLRWTEPRFDDVVNAIGEAAQAQVNLDAINAEQKTARKAKGNAPAYVALYEATRFMPPDHHDPRTVNRVARKHGLVQWPPTGRARLADALLRLFMVSATVEVDGAEHALVAHRGAVSERSQKTGKLRRVGRIWLTPEGERAIENGLTALAASEGPRAERPGRSSRIVKCSRRGSTADVSDAADVVGAVHALNGVTWRVNRRVLAAVKEAWRDGGDLGKMPPRVRDVDTPRRRWWRLPQDEREAVSDHLAFDRMLHVAEEHVRDAAFYFRHEIDHRGRLYAASALLDYQKHDVCRGLLEFASPRAVSDRGRYWLHVHATNCFGTDADGKALDKRPLDQRAAWAERHRQELLDGMWRKADKPFQCLAAAIALDDPEAAEHLPVQVDGSCNAAQHLAALLRDEALGRWVNMRELPHADAPAADFYGFMAYVASAVTERGGPFEQRFGEPFPTQCRQYLDRKVFKAVVMPVFYGLSKSGAFGALYTALKERGHLYADRSNAARYLRGTMAYVLSETEAMDRAFALMATLRRIAEMVGRDGGDVRWKTPTGLLVKPKYRRQDKHTVKDNVLQKFTTYEELDEADAAKSANAITASYVHSLDAAHCVRTIRALQRQRVPMVAVHDSYWGHAAHMDAVAKTLRHEFVRLHEADLLAELHAQLAALIPDADDLPAMPDKGNLHLPDVLDNPFFFA